MLKTDTKSTGIAKSYKYESFLVVCAMLWGLQFSMLKFVSDYFDEVSLLFIKFLLSAIILAAMGYKKIPQNKKVVFHSVMLGILVAVHTYFQTVGLKNTNPANSSFIITTNVIYVPIIEYFIFKRKPGKNVVVGLTFITAGFFLISGIIGLNPLSFNLVLGKGDLLSLICAILTAFYMVYFNYLSSKYDEGAVNIIHIIAAAATMFIVWIFTMMYKGCKMEFSNIPAVIGLLYCGLLSGGVASLLLARGTAHVEASKTAILCGLEPVFATLFAAVLTIFIPSLDGKLTVSTVVGGALIFYGAIKSSLKKQNSKI